MAVLVQDYANFTTKIKQSLLANILICFSSLAIFSKLSYGVEGGEIFTCWFGDPLNDIEQCMQTGCPDDYVCVQRYNYYTEPNFWQGCCEKGNGTCHTETQKGDPAMADYVPPHCKPNGEYGPVQCHFAGCFCSMPDGEMVEGTFYYYGEANPPNCPAIVKELGPADAQAESGDLPVFQPLVEELSFADLGMTKRLAKRLSKKFLKKRFQLKKY